MDFKISNIKVYGLNEAVVSSAYPKSVENDLFEDFKGVKESDWKRAEILGTAKPGSGHDCYLKGVLVQADITASHAFWIQYLRYHFNDIISSQSKMHKIQSFDISSQVNPYVDKDIIRICNGLKAMWLHARSIGAPKKEIDRLFYKLVYNLPMGFLLTARINDNYLSLKTQYQQRKADKLYEWHIYCDWRESLPKFKSIVLGKGGS